MSIYTTDKSGVVVPLRVAPEMPAIYKAPIKTKRRQILRKNKIKQPAKRVFDSEILSEINKNRDKIEKGLVIEGCVVLFRIWIPANFSEGVIDMESPIGKHGLSGYLDCLEAKVKKDPNGVYRLSPRNRGKDIPKKFYVFIENILLAPVLSGSILPYENHIYGKGRIYNVIEYQRFSSKLEQLEIISPREYSLFQGDNDKSLPDEYKKIKP